MCQKPKLRHTKKKSRVRQNRKRGLCTNEKKPDFYNNIENYIKVKGKKVAVFEDSNAVLKLAKDLGFLAIGIETEMNEGKLSNADYIIKN